MDNIIRPGDAVIISCPGAIEIASIRDRIRDVLVGVDVIFMQTGIADREVRILAHYRSGNGFEV